VISLMIIPVAAQRPAARSAGALSPKKRSTTGRPRARAKKTARSTVPLEPGVRLVLLDERRKALSSRQLARQIGQWRDEGCREAVFCIGGADGHDRSQLPHPDLTLAFGPAVFPHKLVRVMLAEQLYRAVSILAGTPYHRD